MAEQWIIRPRPDAWSREGLRERGYASLRDLAARVGVAPSSLSRVAAGSSVPNATTISAVLGCTSGKFEEWFALERVDTPTD